MPRHKPKGNETTKSNYALEEYYLLGYERSLRKLASLLVDKKIERMEEEAFQKGIATPQITDDDKKKMHNTFFKQVSIWSSSYGWQEKAKAYDREQFERKRKKRELEIEKMNDNHAVLASGMVVRAVKQIQDLINEKKFGSAAAVTLFEKASNLERVARGAASEITMSETKITGSLDNSLTIDLSKFSMDQLLSLENIAKQVEDK